MTDDDEDDNYDEDGEDGNCDEEGKDGEDDKDGEVDVDGKDGEDDQDDPWGRPIIQDDLIAALLHPQMVISDQGCSDECKLNQLTFFFPPIRAGPIFSDSPKNGNHF